MLVNTKKIQALSPCKDRLDAYLEKHAEWSGTMTRFLKLDIPFSDKAWVYFRMLPKERLRLVAADIAESVLHIYEAAYPGDLRPRKAIEAARNGSENQATEAADNAADNADNAADNAAYYAANAAYYTNAAAAAHAAAAAAYYAANAAINAATNQEAVNLKIMRKHLKGL